MEARASHTHAPMSESAKDKKDHLHELLASFDTAMLITHHGEKSHGRPKAIAAVEDGAAGDTVWFVTSIDSPKADEISNDARVSATFQTSQKFVALSGTASLVMDRAKIHELWKESWKVWFPEGKDDPAIALVRVKVEDAEFWDNAGAKGVRYAFEAVKALVTGDTPEPVAGLHGRVKANGGTMPESRH